MTDINIAAIVLAAGHGKRMKSVKPKVLHEIGGRAMLGHVLDKAMMLALDRVTLVIGDHAPQVGDYAKRIYPKTAIAIQAPPRGTGDAVAKALPALEGFDGAVLILNGDTPLVRIETLCALAGEIKNGAAVAVLGFRPDDPALYGRLKLNAEGALVAIVETRDATEEERKIDLCNGGVMAIEAAFLHARLKDIDNKNAKNEYYLTDLVGLARADHRKCAMLEVDPDEILGADSRADLAEAEMIFQGRARAEALEGGATLRDPSTVYFSYDTQIGQDVVIGPNVVFGPGVVIEDNVEIKAFSHLEGAKVAAGATVGPFARLRPGANLLEGAKVGNFVEIKNADIGKGAKVSHLTYIGDAEIGAGANIGAGTITCNYDGYSKHKTTIGAGAFIGSNSSLVAPLTIGADAYVGSGSVITKEVDAGDLAVARGRQKALKGWAARFRKTNKGER